jgi:hypothetical protein
LLNLGVPHGLQRLDFFLDDQGSAGKVARVADDLARVDIDGRADGGAADGEVAELEGA